MPRPTTKCRRRDCGVPFSDHEGGLCPNGKGKSFNLRNPSNRVANSFVQSEVVFLSELLRQVARGGDPRLLARMHAKDLGSIAGKTTRMKARLAKRSAATTPTEAS